MDKQSKGSRGTETGDVGEDAGLAGTYTRMADRLGRPTFGMTALPYSIVLLTMALPALGVSYPQLFPLPVHKALHILGMVSVIGGVWYSGVRDYYITSIGSKFTFYTMNKVAVVADAAVFWPAAFLGVFDGFVLLQASGRTLYSSNYVFLAWALFLFSGASYFVLGSLPYWLTARRLAPEKMDLTQDRYDEAAVREHQAFWRFQGWVTLPVSTAPVIASLFIMTAKPALPWLDPFVAFLERALMG